MISLHTSIDDLQSSFKYSIEGHTVACFETAIKEETEGKNRVSVLKLLNRALRIKKQGGRRI